MRTALAAPNTIGPKTRRMGSAKLVAVYCVSGRGSGKPQSQAGARRTAWVARRRATGDGEAGDGG